MIHKPLFAIGSGLTTYICSTLDMFEEKQNHKIRKNCRWFPRISIDPHLVRFLNFLLKQLETWRPEREENIVVSPTLFLTSRFSLILASSLWMNFTFTCIDAEHNLRVQKKNCKERRTFFVLPKNTKARKWQWRKRDLRRNLLAN